MSTQNWIKMSERKPSESDLPVWGWVNGDRPYLCLSMPHKDWTHWRPAAADIPAPPKEESQADKDTEAWLQWYQSADNTNSRQGWNAALAYERAEVLRMLPQPRPLVSYGTGIIETERTIEAIRARCGGAK